MSGLINQRLEKLVSVWFKTLDWTYSISFYSSIDIGEPGNEPIMNLPRCVVACDSANERVKDCQVFDIPLTVTVTHSADDTDRFEHVETCEEIEAVLNDPAKILQFNQTVPFYIFEISQQSNSVEQADRNWISSFTFNVVGVAMNGYSGNA